MSNSKFNLALVERVALESLKQKDSKLRKHSQKKLKKLEKCIKENRILLPLVVNDKNEVIAGNARFEVAKKLGIKEVPIIKASHLSEDELRAFAIADNASVLDAEWNLPELKIELEHLTSIKFDPELIFFEPPQIDVFLRTDSKNDEKSEEENEVLEDIVSRAKYSDLWLLGNHALLCADSTKPKSYQNLLDGRKAKAVISDLPYNLDKNFIGNKGKKKHANFKMGSGEMTPGEFSEFLSTIIKNMQDFSVSPSCHMLFMDWRHIREIMTAAESYEAFKALCIWDKICPAN
jgi:hypothetical protein